MLIIINFQGLNIKTTKKKTTKNNKKIKSNKKTTK